MIKLLYPLVLASASPRRREILEMVGLDFETMPSSYSEPLHSSSLCDPGEFALQLAYEKGKEVFTRLRESRLVLSADTIGVFGNEVLEKPSGRDHAMRMLKLLSGNTHQVLTGIALFSPSSVEPEQCLVKTDVTFRKIGDDEIDRYLDQGEYTDKAASYAIQGSAAIFVERIEGDYFNIVGLPIATVWELLKKYFQITV